MRPVVHPARLDTGRADPGRGQMSTSSDRVAAAVATAARSALSRRFQNAVLAHTETLVDLGEELEPGNPVAKPRDFERYHMAWLSCQALTGIATPKLLRDADSSSDPIPRVVDGLISGTSC